MSRFVRSSKYRHVFGKEAKSDQAVDNIVISKNAWDSNYIAANNSFFAICWQTAGGGAIGVTPMSFSGKLPQQGNPLITGHKAAVLDLDWNPFNDNLLASASEDCYIKIWNVPDGGLTEHMTEPVQALQGHRRKVGGVRFHPCASNILASTSQDYTLKLWDIEKGETTVTLDGPTDIIQSIAWNYDGSRIAATCKDKKVRLADPRTGKFDTVTTGHQGVKGSRCIWVGKQGNQRLFTVGFSRSSERQYFLFDPANAEKPLLQKGIDNSSGILMPFYDYDTSMIYLAGKGDGNIRYFEYTGEDKMVYSLSEFKTNKPCKGGCFMPKTGCSVSDNEVARFLKLEVRRMVPVSFTVPRKSDLFQDDIFPDTASGTGEPSMTASEYMGGANTPPKTVNLEKGFVAKEKVKVEFVKKEVDSGPKGELELRKAWEEQKKRITYLEAELKKAQLKIAELAK